MLYVASRSNKTGRRLRQQQQLRSASAAIPSEASSSGGGVAPDGGAPAKTRSEKLKGYPSSIYKFTRPHTIRGGSSMFLLKEDKRGEGVIVVMHGRSGMTIQAGSD